MTAKDITIKYIRNYCKEHNEKAWYNEEITKMMPCKIYPRIEKDGKKVADKSQEPTIEYRKITFIQIKQDFIAKFMPELAPKKKDKGENMYTPL